jgi:hypothetical protein
LTAPTRLTHAGADLVAGVHAGADVHGPCDGEGPLAELVEQLGAGLLDADRRVGQAGVVERAHAIAVEELGEDVLQLLIAGGDALDLGRAGGGLDLGHVGTVWLGRGVIGGGGGLVGRRGCLTGHGIISRVSPGGRGRIG